MVHPSAHIEKILSEEGREVEKAIVEAANKLH